MALYLVTGGAGFIGSHLALALAERGDRVRVFDDLSSGRRENLQGARGRVELVTGDLADAAAVRAACRGVEGIFHEAAQVSVPQSLADPARSYAVNVSGTLHVLEGARQEGVGQVVFAASSAAYGESEALPKVESMPPAPLSPYASGKVAGEQLMSVWGSAFGLRTVSLRYFNVFGPRQVRRQPLHRRDRDLRQGPARGPPPDDLRRRRADARLQLRRQRRAGQPAGHGSPRPAKRRRDQRGGRRAHHDQPALRDHRRATSESDLVPHYAPERAGDVRHSLASLERARSLLGYEPKVHWRAGLAETVDWYRERLAANRLGA